MRIFWSVAVGAALGGLCRYYLGQFVQQRAGPSFPVGTLLINVTGSFLIGLIIRYALGSGGVSEVVRLFLTTGFCGGYTTFSTFSYDTIGLLRDGEYWRAAVYVLASVMLALVATILGMALGSRILSLREAA